MLAAARSWRARARFAWWVARSRLRLRAAGCRLEVVAAGPVSFHTPPMLVPTRQGGVGAGGGGSLRLELGTGVDLGALCTIEVAPGTRSRIALGDGVTLGSIVRLLAFGGDIEVGAWSRLRDGVSLKSSGRLTCGEHTILQSYTLLHCARQVSVGDRVTLGERVSVLDSDHQLDGSDTYNQEQPLTIEPVHVGSNAWVGANAVLLRGTRLGRNSVVAAGSVVRSGDYPAGWLVAGVPAEPKRPLGGEGPEGAATGSSRPQPPA